MHLSKRLGYLLPSINTPLLEFRVDTMYQKTGKFYNEKIWKSLRVDSPQLPVGLMPRGSERPLNPVSWKMTYG